MSPNELQQLADRIGRDAGAIADAYLNYPWPVFPTLVRGPLGLVFLRRPSQAKEMLQFSDQELLRRSRNYQRGFFHGCVAFCHKKGKCGCLKMNRSEPKSARHYFIIFVI